MIAVISTQSLGKLSPGHEDSERRREAERQLQQRNQERQTLR